MAFDYFVFKFLKSICLFKKCLPSYPFFLMALCSNFIKVLLSFYFKKLFNFFWHFQGLIVWYFFPPLNTEQLFSKILSCFIKNRDLIILLILSEIFPLFYNIVYFWCVPFCFSPLAYALVYQRVTTSFCLQTERWLEFHDCLWLLACWWLLPLRFRPPWQVNYHSFWYNLKYTEKKKILVWKKLVFLVFFKLEFFFSVINWNISLVLTILFSAQNRISEKKTAVLYWGILIWKKLPQTKQNKTKPPILSSMWYF